MTNMFIGPWVAIFGNTKTPGMNWVEQTILIVLLVGILSTGFFLGKALGNPINHFPNNRGYTAISLVVVFLIIGGMMSREKLKVVKTDAKENEIVIAPQLIVSFELAKTQDRAQKIIDTWRIETAGVKGKNISLAKLAERDIKIDFAFILSYIALLGFLCFWIADYNPGTWVASIGSILGWSTVIAGLLDFVENLSLLRMLDNNATTSLAQIAFWTALPKLIIVVWFAAIFIAFAGGYSLIKRYCNNQ